MTVSPTVDPIDAELLELLQEESEAERDRRDNRHTYPTANRGQLAAEELTEEEQRLYDDVWGNDEEAGR